MGKKEHVIWLSIKAEFLFSLAFICMYMYIWRYLCPRARRGQRLKFGVFLSPAPPLLETGSLTGSH